MDPLPWAKSVGPHYGKAQFKEDSDSRPASSQRPPEPLGQPVMPKARPADPPQASETQAGEAYYFNQLERMDQYGRCSAMAEFLSDPGTYEKSQEEMLLYMDELKECLELMEQAHYMQDKTVERLKKDLSLMEDHSQDIANNLSFFQQNYEHMIFLKDAVLAEEEAKVALEKAQEEKQQAEEKVEREAEEAQDAWMYGRLQEFIEQEGITKDKALYLLSPPAKKQKISE